MACDSCRACLYKVEPSEATSISSVCSDGKVISDVLKEIAPVEIATDDAFPKIICSMCLQRLKDFCEFRTVIVRSDEKLREMQGHAEIKVEDYPVEDFKVERSEPDVALPDIEVILINLPDTDPFDMDKCPTKSPKRKASGGRRRRKRSAAVNGETVPAQKKTVKRRKPHTCTECGRNFISKKNLDLHIAHRHTGGEMPHICDVCGKGYPHAYMLKTHRLSHFDEKSYICPVEGCGKTFRFPSSLSMHHKIHLGTKYKCDVCGKLFTYVGGLQAHKRVHNGEKTVCEVCGLSFANISRHLEVHNKPPPIPCPICGKSYKDKKGLKTHMETHIDKEERGVECEICKKKFAPKSLLVHKRVHEGVKPYTCKICNKSFRQSGVLRKHRRVHTMETPFHCTFCSKKFGYKHHLKSHIAKAHQESPY